MDTLEGRIPEQIDIMVNEECNARCGMCIQEITYKSGSDSENYFIDAVQNHFRDFYELGGRKVIITGGEPTLRPAIVEKVLQELAKYEDLELVAMYTNGSRLLKERDGKSIAQRLLNAGLQFVNLSVHHYDVDKNNAVFGIEKDDPRDVSAHLRQMFEVQLGDTGGLSPKRLPVVKKGIEYIRENFVDVRPIVDELAERDYLVDENREFQGRKKHETRYQTPDGFNFFISTLEIGTENAKELPYLVIMPNGGLYSTWMGETSRIESLRR